MKLILDTIEFCKIIAEDRNHPIGPFCLTKVNDFVWVLSAICQNKECWWAIGFDAFGLPRKKHGSFDTLQPYSSTFVAKNCQHFLTKPTQKEIETIKVAEENLKKEFGYEIKYYSGRLPDLSPEEIHFQIIDSIAHEEIPTEEIPNRKQRRSQIEPWLLANFPIIEPKTA